METLMRNDSFNRMKSFLRFVKQTKKRTLLNLQVIQVNERSSQSHAIFSITIECSDKGPDGGKRIRVGKLHMVDLAVKCVQMKRK